MLIKTLLLILSCHFVILMNGFFFFRHPAHAFDRNTTDDISLLNRDYYRVVHRADTISPGKQFTETFKPLSIRESNSLFQKTGTPALLKSRAEKYYPAEAHEKEMETFSINPLKELHVTAIHSDREDAPLYGSLGAELEGDVYLSSIAAGNAYVRDLAVFSYDLRLSNDGDVDTVDLFRYKLKSGLEHISISLSKDNVVVGPGYFGNLIQSNNVQPENSAILKTEIPYNWGVLGAFRWYAWHTWFDDDERPNKDPRLLGARVSLAPWNIFEIAFTRTALYGGSENASFDSLEAYWEMITGANENVNDNPYNSQQQGSFDMSVYLPFIQNYTPFAGGKLYMEYAFSDVRAFWQTEDKGSGVIFEPLADSYLLGMILTTGQTDIILEYLYTSQRAYTGGGSGFKLGYTDNGYSIGHFAGGGSNGFMGEIYHELSPILHAYVGLGYFRHQNFINSDPQTEKDFYAGITCFFRDSLSMNLKGTYTHFDKTDTNPSPVIRSFNDEGYSNTMIHFSLDYYF